MIIKGVFPVLVFIVMVNFLSIQQSYCQTKEPKYKTMETEVLTLINAHRAENKQKPLKVNETIVEIAKKHSYNMANSIIPFGHDGYDERMEGMQKILKKTGNNAENVAMGATTAKQVVNMWLNSKMHKENIEGNYNETGIGIETGTDGNLYFTQIFFENNK